MYCCRNQETLEFEQLDPETEQYVDSDFRLPKNQRHYLWQDENRGHRETQKNSK
jgi:hypothetical protein